MIYRFEQCIDLDSYHPVYGKMVYNSLRNNEVQATTTGIGYYYDINVPVEITLAIP
jgi:hypothetical protein